MTARSATAPTDTRATGKNARSPPSRISGELVRAGRLTPQEAERHPHRAVITRVVGTEPEVDVDVFTEHAEPGDDPSRSTIRHGFGA